MKATATLETVIDRVHQMSVNQYDEIVPVQDMEFDSLNQMWISGRRVEILPSAQRLLSNRLRVPFSYLSRCPRPTSRNLNFWIEKEREQRDTSFAASMGTSFGRSSPNDVPPSTTWRSSPPCWVMDSDLTRRFSIPWTKE